MEGLHADDHEYAENSKSKCSHCFVEEKFKLDHEHLAHKAERPHTK